jgi:hypothetical protein
MKNKRLDALIALLDDPDNSVFDLVLDELLKEDISVVDQLEHIWETSLDDLVQKRIEEIIQKIQFKDTKEKIKHWADHEAFDLFEGFFLISRYQYPEIKLKSIQIQLERIRKDIWLEFRNSLTALEKIAILNHIFYDSYKFNVDSSNPDSPQNCYLNRILETKKGNSISIAILYTLIGRSLNLPIYYIDFQKNPLIGYFDNNIDQLSPDEKTAHSVQFYINSSNKGAIIGLKEAEYIQQAIDEVERQKFTKPCPDRLIIKRLIERLIMAYEELGAQERINYLNEITAIL